jgi:outer membrane receptor protein involved in Fe transport
MEAYIKKLLLLLLGIILLIPATAAEPAGISGKIKESGSNKAIAFANVYLADSSGKALSQTYSNEDGTFTLTNSKKAVTLKVVMVGFKPFSMNYSQVLSTPALNISLEAMDMLKEVKVTAEKPRMEVVGDKLVMNVEKLAVTEGGNATDVLKIAPSITVDIDGNVSYRGDKNVKILIDGRPASRKGGKVSDVLQNLSAADIEKIEIISNPSAKYAASGSSGIINIVLKKDKRPGFTGTVGGDINQVGMPSGMASLHFSNKWLTVEAGYSVRYRKSFEGQDVATKSFSPDTSVYQEIVQRGFNKSHSNNPHIGLSANLSEHDQIELNGWLSNFGMSNEKHRVTLFNDPTVAPNLFSNNSSSFLFEGTWYGSELGYTHEFKTEGEQLMITGAFSRGNSHTLSYAKEVYSTLDHTNPGPANYNRKVNNKGFDDSYNANITYTHPFKNKTEIEVGYDFMYASSKNTNAKFFYDTSASDYTKPNGAANAYNYHQGIHSVFASYRGEAKGFGYEFGLRMEATDQKGYLLSNNTSYAQRYFSFFPTIHLNKKMKEGEMFRFSYSRRIHRPEWWELLPVSDDANARYQWKGNPELRPEITNAFELAYNKTYKKGFINTAIYYRLTEQVFSWMQQIDSRGVVTESEQNLATSHAIGAEYSMTYNFNKWASATGSVNARYESLQDPHIGRYAHYQYWAAGGNLMLNFTPYKWWTIQALYDLEPGSPNLQGFTHYEQMFDMASRWKVLKDRLIITAKVSDLFNTGRDYMLLKGPGYSSTTYSKGQTRFFTLGITYRFGFNRKAENNNDDNILQPGEHGGGGGGRR